MNERAYVMSRGSSFEDRLKGIVQGFIYEPYEFVRKLIKIELCDGPARTNCNADNVTHVQG